MLSVLIHKTAAIGSAWLILWLVICFDGKVFGQEFRNLIAEIEGSRLERSSLRVSPNAARVAYIERARGTGHPGVVMVVDGEAERMYDTIWEDSVAFSPDSRRMAYVAELNRKWVMVVDGMEGKRYDRIGYPLFSPDSAHVMYPARIEDKWMVVLDGAEGELFDNVGDLTFSPDSRHIAFKGKIKYQWKAVVDGEVQEGSYDDIDDFVFSPDGAHVAFEARTGLSWVAIIDGRGEGEYNGIGTIMFSPDSRQVAYDAKAGLKWVMVINGSQGTARDFILIPRLYQSEEEEAYVLQETERLGYRMDPSYRTIFSPGSSTPVYAVRTGPDWFTVINGAAANEYDEIKGLTFSPDGERIAYRAQRGGRWRAVVNGKEQGNYDGIAPEAPVFSPDGERIAYQARKGARWLVVVDGREGEMYSEVGRPVFSPDSRRVAYKAKQRNAWYLVVDGEETESYEDIAFRTVVFSPDSGAVAYWAKKSGRWYVTVDGGEGKGYDELFKMPGSPFVRNRIVFDSPTRLYYLAWEQKLSDESIYLVERFRRPSTTRGQSRR